MPRLEYVTPILCVADVTASIRYYRERLGFETTFTLDWGVREMNIGDPS